MKNILLTILSVFISLSLFAQDSTITPLNNSFDSELIKNENYEMTWSMEIDTSKIEIGKIKTEIKRIKNNVLIITSVKLNQAQTKWVDTTLAHINNLKPIYHSSYNQQRDMVLHFDKKVTGYYFDKKTNTKNEIAETTSGSYFDSNIYPQLIRWLPLNNEYHKTISIFDYNPSAKTGVIKAFIKNIKKGKVRRNRDRDVWIVKVTDDITDNKAIMTFYIDINNRQIIRQEVDMQGRKMIMELIN
ncbi:hypothetical protein CXF68_15845 [Tenacibaculum sp. Bg11-29]|uniref:DUF3108 domain-containing protein n=1 Tax=Tenacibaculum sp. Bg11-29 TaxID=2058306 RepID=UPI000C32CE16|nr:hypothetical protein [Tenacibaculum sp. Bg11-29]PKH52076.1 hypothetical protein CXF68_15845 [Tenacibaculum sp. Bg11-29]